MMTKLYDVENIDTYDLFHILKKKSDIFSNYNNVCIKCKYLSYLHTFMYSIDFISSV